MIQVLLILVVVVLVGTVTGEAGGGCDCQPIVVCAINFELIQSACKLQDGSKGVCCPPEGTCAGTAETRTGAAGGSSKGGGMLNINTRALFSESLRGTTRQDLWTAASKVGIQAVIKLINLEQSLMHSNNVLPRDTPAWGHVHQSRISQQARDMDKQAWAIVSASSKVMTSLNLSSRQGGQELKNIRVSQTALRDQCPQSLTCTNGNSKYRTVDGSCNNLKNPYFGKSNTPAQRILPPTYDDGVSSARTRATDGSLLPNVRNISSTILVDIDKPDRQFTLSVMQWAQFMDHDFAHTPFPSLDNGEGIQCCSTDPNFPRHPRCWPIDITGDSFYSQHGRTCMNFVRSMLAVGSSEACTFGFADQLNQLTHWIDASTVYGNTQEQQRAVRSMRNGLLKTSAGNMLPFTLNEEGESVAALHNTKLFLAGDSRVNEQPSLTVIHTLWMREHNRVATELQRLNPLWSDEEVFQETRRIIAAEIQHIVYHEWLPIIIDTEVINSSGLSTRRQGFSRDYDSFINPNMINEFSTAAFRFGHSLVQGTIAMFSSDGSVRTSQLRDNFNAPFLIQNEGRFNDLVRALIQFPSQKFDNFITEDLTNHLFQTPQFNFGLDLMSLNIHRGRDHGIATYNSIREACGLPLARNFNDLRDHILPRLIEHLQRLYKSVDDIDLFVGGMSETSLPHGLMGPTFNCIIADQFARLKKGDRFFYDLEGQAGSFTAPQLQQLRRVSWARIICDNSDLRAVQPLAFQLPVRDFNAPSSCSGMDIPKLDLSLWADGK